MALNTVTNQFLAALGVERRLEKAAEDHLQHFYWKILTAYRKEVQYERARLMRKSLGTSTAAWRRRSMAPFSRWRTSSYRRSCARL